MGELTRPPAPWRSWTAEQWQAYRAEQVAACTRFGDPWRSNVGLACVALADWHLARLAAGVAA